MSKKMTKTLTSALTSLASGLQTSRSNKTSSRQSQSRTRRRNRRRFYTPRGMPVTRSLPAAFVRTPVAKFSTRAIDNGILVNGCDLVYRIPSTISKLVDPVFAIIPSNPLFWKGTRICSIANMYQNYRPLSFRVHYIPQVAVTQPGTVVMGTVWETTASSGDIQQTLLTSNGGLSTPCYSPASTNIRLATNLSMNLYRVHETGTYDSVPFNFLAVMAGGEVVPGYFFVSYSYIFKNAMGGSWVASTFSTKIKELPVSNQENTHEVKYDLGQNTSIVTRAPCKDARGNTYGAGKTFAVEAATKARNVLSVASDVASVATGLAGIGYVVKDNGSDVVLPADLPVDVFTTTSATDQSSSPFSTMSLALANKVPSTTTPTNILPSDISVLVQWDTISPIRPSIKTTGATVLYGIPFITHSTKFTDVEIRLRNADILVSILVPVRAGSSVRFPDSTFSSTFEHDTLLHYVGYRPSPETDVSLVVLRLPAEQALLPVMAITHSWQAQNLPNCWLAASPSGPSGFSFANILTSNVSSTGVYNSLDTISLAGMNTSTLFSASEPFLITDYLSGGPADWLYTTSTPVPETTEHRSAAPVPASVSASSDSSSSSLESQQ